MMVELKPGGLARSCQGRDKDHLYIVLRLLDHGLAEVVDGQKRTVDQPKRKNVKHLYPITEVNGEPAGGIMTGSINDIAVREYLKRIANTNKGEEGGSPWPEKTS